MTSEHTGKYLKKYLITVDIKPVFVKERTDGETLVNDTVSLEQILGQNEAPIRFADSLGEALTLLQEIMNHGR